MAGKRRFSVARVAAAIIEAHGIFNVAARVLECDRTTIENYVHRYPTCAEAARVGREGILDLAEGKLFLNIKAGQERAIEFTLSTIGRARGYGNRLDIGIDQDIERELARLGVARKKAAAGEAEDDPESG